MFSAEFKQSAAPWAPLGLQIDGLPALAAIVLSLTLEPYTFLCLKTMEHCSVHNLLLTTAAD